MSYNDVIRPKYFIYILCESCWNDKWHFKELFNPLIDEGATSLRTISPVFGGGTPNAEFEMYTGLSSKRIFNGIIF